MDELTAVSELQEQQQQQQQQHEGDEAEVPVPPERSAFKSAKLEAVLDELQQLQALHAQPGRRLWFCGSYAQAGIPLLESAVRSADDVAQRFDQGLGQGLRADHSA